MDSPALSSPNLKKQRPQDPFSPGFLESNRLLSNINRQIQVSGGDPVIFYDDSIIKTKSWQQYGGVNSTPNNNMKNTTKASDLVISDDESSEGFNDELLTEDSNILHNDDNPSHDGEHDVVDGEISKTRTAQEQEEANLPYLTEEAAMAMEVTPEDLPVSIQERVRRLYSTTSTVLVKDTLSSPNSSEILFCIAAVLQAQIFENDSLPVEKKALHPEFNLIPLLPPEDGGVVEQVADAILAQETQNDEELRDCILRGVVPSIDTIVRYLLGIHRKANYSSECNIIAIIYLNRITSLSGLPITSMNWRSLWVVSVILAQKVWSDTPMKTSLFHSILPSVSKKQLKDLEMKALCLLQYCTIVKPSLYAKYYFELRQLFTDIIGNKLDMQLSMKPLSIIQAKFLEMRTNYIPYVKHKDNRIRRMDKAVSNKSKSNGKTSKKSSGSGQGSHGIITDGSNHGNHGNSGYYGRSNSNSNSNDVHDGSNSHGVGVDMEGLCENHDHNVSMEANTSIESMHSSNDSKGFDGGNRTTTSSTSSSSSPNHHSRYDKSLSDDNNKHNNNNINNNININNNNGKNSHSHSNSNNNINKKKSSSYKSTPKLTNNWLMEDISHSSRNRNTHGNRDIEEHGSRHRKSSKPSSSSSSRSSKKYHRSSSDIDVDLNIDAMDVNGSDHHHEQQQHNNNSNNSNSNNSGINSNSSRHHTALSSSGNGNSPNNNNNSNSNSPNNSSISVKNHTNSAIATTSGSTSTSGGTSSSSSSNWASTSSSGITSTSSRVSSSTSSSSTTGGGSSRAIASTNTNWASSPNTSTSGSGSGSGSRRASGGGSSTYTNWASSTSSTSTRAVSTSSSGGNSSGGTTSGGSSTNWASTRGGNSTSGGNGTTSTSGTTSGGSINWASSSGNGTTSGGTSTSGGTTSNTTSSSINWAVSSKSDVTRSHRGMDRGMVDKVEVRHSSSRVALKPSTFEDVTRTDTSRYVIS